MNQQQPSTPREHAAAVLHEYIRLLSNKIRDKEGLSQVEMDFLMRISRWNLRYK